MKAYLKNKWQSIHAAYKNKLKQQMNPSSRPPVPTEDRPQQAQAAAQEEASREQEEFKGEDSVKNNEASRTHATESTVNTTSQHKRRSIPYVPNYSDVDQYCPTGVMGRDLFIRKFITKLQTPAATEADLHYEKSVLLRAIDIAKDLEQAIFDSNKTDMLRKSKFRSLMSVLQEHPHMRTKLLNGRVSVLEFIRMKRDDFLSAELKRQKSEAEERQIQASRIDFARASDMKKGFKDSFFTCRKCKSKKTSYYQQ